MAKNELLSCLQDQDVSTIMRTKVDNMLVYPWTPILDYSFTTDPYLESKNIEHSFEEYHVDTTTLFKCGHEIGNVARKIKLFSS